MLTVRTWSDSGRSFCSCLMMCCLMCASLSFDLSDSLLLTHYSQLQPATAVPCFDLPSTQRPTSSATQQQRIPRPIDNSSPLVGEFARSRYACLLQEL